MGAALASAPPGPRPPSATANIRSLVEDASSLLRRAAPTSHRAANRRVRAGFGSGMMAPLPERWSTRRAAARPRRSVGGGLLPVGADRLGRLGGLEGTDSADVGSAAYRCDAAGQVRAGPGRRAGTQTQDPPRSGSTAAGGNTPSSSYRRSALGVSRAALADAPRVSSPRRHPPRIGHATGTNETAAFPRVKVKHNRQAHHPRARYRRPHGVPASWLVVAHMLCPTVPARLTARPGPRRAGRRIPAT